MALNGIYVQCEDLIRINAFYLGDTLAEVE